MRWITSLFVVIVAASTAEACLWDYDTLRDERRGLPGIAEILAGKWEKHSDFFYRHRVEQMEKLIAAEPQNLAAYDNLAVAHEKLGDQDRAIDVMLTKEKIAPGQYTTYANLGTFYLHKGDFDNGIAYIEKALEINPDAHFGREEYQLMLAKFLRDARADPTLRETSNFLEIELKPQQRSSNGALGRPAPPITDLGVKSNAIEGIVGMIRFGTGTSPDLYFALGELLAYRGDKHLAYRAYRRAAELGHPRREEIAQFMEQVKSGVEDGSGFDDALIERERAEASAWVAAYQQYEDQLVRGGQDTTDEANYTAFYAQHGPAVPEIRPTLRDRFLPRDRETRVLIIAGAALIGLLALWVLARHLLFSARRAQPPAV